MNKTDWACVAIAVGIVAGVFGWAFHQSSVERENERHLCARAFADAKAPRDSLLIVNLNQACRNVLREQR